MSVELEPLLSRLAGLAPRFGRLTGDIEAMVSRGRAGDFKGVMQNARLVVEALCRSIVTDDLKQTPGKAMLDDLVQKLRQQQNQKVVPTNVLAHIGTVQAWGNLSSHDHAGSLDDAGVQVGEQEVAASLNSVVAILAWYAEKKGLTAAPPRELATPYPGASAIAPAAAKPAHKTNHGKAFALLGLFVVMGVAGSVLVLRVKGPKDTSNPFAAADTVYSAWGEPAPPRECRHVADAPSISSDSNNFDALKLLDSPSEEMAYLQARAAWTQTRTEWPGLSKAFKCAGFANPHYLAANIATSKSDLATAEKEFQAAVKIEPKWLEARMRLALLLARRGNEAKDETAVEDALRHVEAIIRADPGFGRAYFLRGTIKRTRSPGDASAVEDFCKAGKLGVPEGKDACAQLSDAAAGGGVPAKASAEDPCGAAELSPEGRAACEKSRSPAP